MKSLTRRLTLKLMGLATAVLGVGRSHAQDTSEKGEERKYGRMGAFARPRLVGRRVLGQPNGKLEARQWRRRVPVGRKRSHRAFVDSSNHRHKVSVRDDGRHHSSRTQKE